MIKSKVNNLIISSKAFLEAFFYILKNRWIWNYMIFAVFLNVIIFIILATFLFIFSDFISSQLTLNLEQNIFIKSLDFLLQIILWIILIFLLNFVFNSISSVVNTPIYSSLTSKIIEKELPEINFPEINIFTEIRIALVFEFKKILLSITFLICSFLLNLIPFLGSILFLILNILQIIFISGLDFFEPYHSLKKLRFRKRLLEISNNFTLYFPFLLICGLLSNVPFLNIFSNPVSIVGAAIIAKKRLFVSEK
jgi:uncharacterized protein involved in cysteine biosynthesis